MHPRSISQVSPEHAENAEVDERGKDHDCHYANENLLGEEFVAVLPSDFPVLLRHEGIHFLLLSVLLVSKVVSWRSK